MKNIFTTFLLLIGISSMAQSEIKLNNLFDKKWVIISYDIAGINIPSTDHGNNNYTIFYADYNVKAVDQGITTLSKWKFEVEKNALILFSEEQNITTELKIFSLTETEFVWETTNPEGMLMTIHMVSETK